MEPTSIDFPYGTATDDAWRPRRVEPNTYGKSKKRKARKAERQRRKAGRR